MIVEIFAGGAVMACLASWLARRFGRSAWWGVLAPPLAVLALWSDGSVWIFSSSCGDVQICDSGGWLAFSADMAFVSLVATLGAVVACLVVRLVRK